MTVSVLESTDVRNKLEDLSGVVLKPGENPYNALIEACHNDPVCTVHFHRLPKILGDTLSCNYQ
jgi:hypothetical protein